MSEVTVRALDKIYPAGTVHAVKSVDLRVAPGELLCLLGPSGCGKTTVLKMIAGLEPPSGGDILFDGGSVLSTKAEERGAVMVFQDHLLFPYMTVGENVSFGLRMRHVPKGEIDERVQRMLEMVQLCGMADRSPSQLSGGQRQRVALARALVVAPRVLLLDEPLSNLDASLRDEMRDLICRLQGELSVTTIFVTHSQSEAVQLADRIALMFDGEIVQMGSARDFYDRPTSPRVAAFFGNKNVFSGTRRGDYVDCPVGRLRLCQSTADSGTPSECYVYFRPEAVGVEPLEEKASGPGQSTDSGAAGGTDTTGANTLDGELISCVYLGTYTKYTIRVGESVIEARTNPVRACPEAGTPLRVTLPTDRIWISSGHTAPGL